MPDQVLASPNQIVQTYFGIARRTSDCALAAADRDSEREYAHLSILPSVAAVEAFLNVWCRTFTEFEPTLREHRDQIIEDLRHRKDVKHALKSWPRLLFGPGLDLGSGHGQPFVAVLDLRNSLMHVTTSLDTTSLDLGGYGTITLQGLNNPEPYHGLLSTAGRGGFACAVGVVRQFFGLFTTAGSTPPEEQTHLWTGLTIAEQDALFAA